MPRRSRCSRPESAPTVAWSCDLNLPCVVVVARAQPDLDTVLGQQLGKALTPLDENHGLTVKQFIEPQRFHLTRLIETVQIDVVQATVAILVDECEGRAGDFV